MVKRKSFWGELAAEWREAWQSWREEWRAWRAALSTAEGLMVALAITGFGIFLLGLFAFGLEWDRLVALARHGGQCVQFLSGTKAAFFVIGTIVAVISSLFFIAEALHLYIHRRYLKQWWSPWLVGLGASSVALWLGILLALDSWCF